MTGFIFSILGSALYGMVARVDVYVLKDIHEARFGVDVSECRGIVSMSGVVLDSDFTRKVKVFVGVKISGVKEGEKRERLRFY